MSHAPSLVDTLKCAEAGHPLTHVQAGWATRHAVEFPDKDYRICLCGHRIGPLFKSRAKDAAQS